MVEQSTGELSFGVGYSTSEGVIGDISLTERNLMGNGQFLRLSLSGSFERLQVELSFTEPRFLDRNLAAGFDLFHKELDLTIAVRLREPTDSAATVRLGLPDHREAVDADQLHDSRGTKSTTCSADASLAIQEAAGITYTSLVGTSLTYDLRNDPKNPTKGLFFQAGVDFAGLGGDVQYIRATRPRPAATTRSPTRSPSSAVPSAAPSRAGVARTCA